MIVCLRVVCVLGFCAGAGGTFDGGFVLHMTIACDWCVRWAIALRYGSAVLCRALLKASMVALPQGQPSNT